MVKYFTSDQAEHQRIAEFYERPIDLSLSLGEFRPDLLLVEDTPAFQSFTSHLPPQLVLAHTAHYYEVRTLSP